MITLFQRDYERITYIKLIHYAMNEIRECLEKAGHAMENAYMRTQSRCLDFMAMLNKPVLLIFESGSQTMLILSLQGILRRQICQQLRVSTPTQLELFTAFCGQSSSRVSFPVQLTPDMQNGSGGRLLSELAWNALTPLKQQLNGIVLRPGSHQIAAAVHVRSYVLRLYSVTVYTRQVH